MTVDQEGGYSLAHPVYLDVPMMISFLAHLEGGVSVQEEETRKETGARDRALRSRAGLRFRLPTFLEGDAGAEHATQRRDETSLESKTQRHHTNASLFNVLYEYLRSDDQIVNLRVPDDLHTLRGGQLVELAGEYLGNPLEDTLAYLGSLLPYLDEQQEAQRAAAGEALASTRRNERSGNPARRREAPTPDVTAMLENLTQQAANADQEFGKKMIVRMVEDIAKVPVHDVLLQADDGLRAVLTVSSEFYSTTTNEYLKAGEFRVVGKVTQVLTGERTINLARRTVLGVAGAEVTTELIGRMQEAFPASAADPIVAAPAVQILPMAIFL